MREFLVTFFLPALVMNLVLELLVVEVDNTRKTFADVCGHNLATGGGFLLGVGSEPARPVSLQDYPGRCPKLWAFPLAPCSLSLDPGH